MFSRVGILILWLSNWFKLDYYEIHYPHWILISYKLAWKLWFYDLYRHIHYLKQVFRRSKRFSTISKNLIFIDKLWNQVFFRCQDEWSYVIRQSKLIDFSFTSWHFNNYSACSLLRFFLTLMHLIQCFWSVSLYWTQKYGAYRFLSFLLL